LVEILFRPLSAGFRVALSHRPTRAQFGVDANSVPVVVNRRGLARPMLLAACFSHVTGQKRASRKLARLVTTSRLAVRKSSADEMRVYREQSAQPEAFLSLCPSSAQNPKPAGLGRARYRG
jgi:hypothetical protein